ncbi:flagellar hook-associated protein FlgK [Metabacillus sp. HB246100]
MTSTFFGLEIAKRGMFTQQSALSTTAHNIANANTPGYTRQRVNFVQTEAYPPVSKNSPVIPGQLGTGVEAGTVERVRESFLDVQYRNENNKVGYWENRANALEKMEEIMNEPSETGLSVTMDRFWQSLQDLALDPTNAGARSVVRERGIALAETFNYLSSSLTSVQSDLKNELNVSIKEINSLATQINNINKQISQIEPHGYIPNDLYDERDRLIDQLSTLTNIKVTYTPSGGNPSKIAEGSVTIELLDELDNTTSLGTLVDGIAKTTNSMQVGYHTTNGLVENISIGANTIDIMNFNNTGKISSLIDSYGYTFDNTGTQVEQGVYPEMLLKLDTMAYEFATRFNEEHQKGYNITDYKAGSKVKNIDFFTPLAGLVPAPPASPKGAAGLISISKDIEDSTDNIAAALLDSSGNITIGNSQNAINLANVKTSLFVIGTETTTLQNYFEGIIGGMAVDTQEAERLTINSQTLRDAVDTRRQSVSAVSLDEEMTNMIQFQHAYNASARMITLQDEVLDRIINGMGLSGR